MRVDGIVLLQLENLTGFIGALQTSTRAGGAQRRNIQAQAVAVIMYGLRHVSNMAAASSDKATDRAKEKQKTDPTPKGKDAKDKDSSSKSTVPKWYA